MNRSETVSAQAAFCAAAMIAHQVAGKATRDALFLSLKDEAPGPE